MPVKWITDVRNKNPICDQRKDKLKDAFSELDYAQNTVNSVEKV